jgi:hypothetical protein
MSYDFYMMKPKIEINSPDDLAEEALLQQDPDALVPSLSALFPELTWQRERDGSWFGSLDGEGYEFRIDAKPDHMWSVHTSHRTNTRKLIPVICDALDLIAFDGQKNLLIKPREPDRRAPAR